MDNKVKILDIAMNLNRVGNWSADGFSSKQKRILMFLAQTSNYLKSIDQSLLNESFRKVFLKFLEDYRVLEQKAKNGQVDDLEWAEKMMTWGNILTHRSKLL